MKITATKNMNPRLVLLLTRDRNLQKLLAEGLFGGAAIVLIAHNVGDALKILCQRGRDLDMAVIDFDDGCHGMTLLSAVNTCRKELPIIVVTSTDAYHAAALAYANDVAACLAKPITVAELEIVIRELGQPKLELAAA